MFWLLSRLLALGSLMSVLAQAGTCVDIDFDEPVTPGEAFTLFQGPTEFYHQAKSSSSILQRRQIEGPLYLSAERPYFLGRADKNLRKLSVDLKQPMAFLGLSSRFSVSSGKSQQLDDVMTELKRMYQAWTKNKSKEDLAANQFPDFYQTNLKKIGYPEHSLFYENMNIAGIFIYRENRDGHIRREYILLNPLHTSIHFY